MPLADKIDNIRATIKDLRDPLVGEKVWARFKTRDRGDQLWLYASLLKAFRKVGVTGYLVEEFGRKVDELHSLAGTANPG